MFVSPVPSLLQAICVGPENLQVMYPAIFEQLLLFVEFSCKPPQYGRMETKHVANAKCNQVGGRSRTARKTTWVSLACVVEFFGGLEQHLRFILSGIEQARHSSSSVHDPPSLPPPHLRVFSIPLVEFHEF